MFKHRLAITGTLAAVMFLLSLAVIGYAQTAYPPQAGKDMKMDMPKGQTYEYLVISPHTAQECLTTLDDVSKLGKDVLARYDWGCMSGDHTGYIKVRAASQEEALKVVPESIRAKARAIKIGKFTTDEIAMFHKSH